MGKWADEFALQANQFTKERLNTRNAMQLIAYWAEALGVAKSRSKWEPLMRFVLKNVPTAPKQSLAQRVLFKDPLIPNPLSDAFKSALDSVLEIDKPTEPAVTPTVKARLLDFMQRAAASLDASKPNDRVPRFRKKDFTDKGAKLAVQAFSSIFRKRKKGNTALALAALALIMLWNPR